MNVTIEQRVAMESSHHLLAHLKQFSVTLLSTAGTENQNGWEIFSGTLVRVGSRVLVATASHALDDPNPGHYRVLADRPSHKDNWVKLIRVGRTETGGPDVGFLEIDPQTLTLLPKKSPCPLTRLHVRRDTSENRLVSLVGAPFALADTVSSSQGKILAAQSMFYSTYTVPFDDVKISEPQPPLDKNIDILLEYPAEAAETIRLDTHAQFPLPHPHGMSGGAIWDQNFEPQLWSPESAILVGIQCAWFEDSRYLRAVQIVHWLRLLHKAYQDLRPLLDKTYSGCLRKV